MNDLKTFSATCVVGLLILDIVAALATGVMIGLDRVVEYAVRRSYNGDTIRNQKILLVLSAVGLGSSYYAGSRRLLKLHAQNHTGIVYKDIKSIDDINTAIETLINNHNTITALFIRAHGTPNAMWLVDKFDRENAKGIIVNHDKKVFESDVEIVLGSNTHLLEKSLNRLASDATIILESCSTGNIAGNIPCIAQTIATLAPGRLVIAPVQPCGAFNEFTWENKSLKIKLTDLNRKTVFTHIFSLYSARLGFSSFLKDFTARFRSLYFH